MGDWHISGGSQMVSRTVLSVTMDSIDIPDIGLSTKEKTENINNLNITIYYIYHYMCFALGI